MTRSPENNIAKPKKLKSAAQEPETISGNASLASYLKNNKNTLEEYRAKLPNPIQQEIQRVIDLAYANLPSSSQTKQIATALLTSAVIIGTAVITSQGNSDDANKVGQLQQNSTGTTLGNLTTTNSSSLFNSKTNDDLMRQAIAMTALTLPGIDITQIAQNLGAYLPRLTGAVFGAKGILSNAASGTYQALSSIASGAVNALGFPFRALDGISRMPGIVAYASATEDSVNYGDNFYSQKEGEELKQFIEQAQSFYEQGVKNKDIDKAAAKDSFYKARELFHKGSNYVHYNSQLEVTEISKNLGIILLEEGDFNESLQEFREYIKGRRSYHASQGESLFSPKYDQNKEQQRVTSLLNKDRQWIASLLIDEVRKTFNQDQDRAISIFQKIVTDINPNSKPAIQKFLFEEAAKDGSIRGIELLEKTLDVTGWTEEDSEAKEALDKAIDQKWSSWFNDSQSAWNPGLFTIFGSTESAKDEYITGMRIVKKVLGPSLKIETGLLDTAASLFLGGLGKAQHHEWKVLAEFFYDKGDHFWSKGLHGEAASAYKEAGKLYANITPFAGWVSSFNSELSKIIAVYSLEDGLNNAANAAVGCVLCALLSGIAASCIEISGHESRPEGEHALIPEPEKPWQEVMIQKLQLLAPIIKYTLPALFHYIRHEAKNPTSIEAFSAITSNVLSHVFAGFFYTTMINRDNVLTLEEKESLALDKFIAKSEKVLETLFSDIEEKMTSDQSLFMDENLTIEKIKADKNHLYEEINKRISNVLKDNTMFYLTTKNKSAKSEEDPKFLFLKGENCDPSPKALNNLARRGSSERHYFEVQINFNLMSMMDNRIRELDKKPSQWKEEKIFDHILESLKKKHQRPTLEPSSASAESAASPKTTDHNR